MKFVNLLAIRERYVMARESAEKYGYYFNAENTKQLTDDLETLLNEVDRLRKSVIELTEADAWSKL